jgi:hypothetical protein
MELDGVIAAAEKVAAGLERDVQLASTREEHVRLTARWNEAVALVNLLVANQPS